MWQALSGIRKFPNDLLPGRFKLAVLLTPERFKLLVGHHKIQQLIG